MPAKRLKKFLDENNVESVGDRRAGGLADPRRPRRPVDRGCRHGDLRGDLRLAEAPAHDLGPLAR